MTGHRSKIPSSAYKLAAFAVVTTALTGLLATMVGNISFVESRTYFALFTDATGVFKGDRVRMSGVEIGSVRGLEIVEGPDGTRLAKVTFTVHDGVPLYADAALQLRYENIVGQRYLAIRQSPRGAEHMEEGETFPLSQTSPALSLTELFNGFQPLFRALEPDQLNEFSSQLVRALQGESGDLAGFLRDISRLTHTIADRDAVIGDVVSNLNAVLLTVGRRDGEFSALIVQFRDLMKGLAKDGGALQAALPDLEALLAGTAQTIAEVRGPLHGNFTALEDLIRKLYDTRSDLEDSLQYTPHKLKALARTGSYGSWFNFYACSISAELQLLDGTVRVGGAGVAANETDTVCAGGIER